MTGVIFEIFHFGKDATAGTATRLQSIVGTNCRTLRDGAKHGLAQGSGTYEHFMTNTLLRSPFVREVQSSFVLKELKSTTELPL